MKVALYARVSTDDRNQDATLQLPALRNLAERRGYDVVAEYIDEASAKDANRPKWKELMASASKHDIDAIMATKLDRIMRSIVHLDTTMQQLNTYNVQLIFLDMEVDTRSPNGRLQLHLISAIAEWERDIIASRTSEGMQARKARGQKFGRKERDDIPIMDIAAMRISGKGWKIIAAETGIPRSTLHDRKKHIDEATERLLEQGSVNVPVSEQGSVKGGSV